MKLSELIIDYRSRMNISQREFSRKCALSNTYISFLENEKNPKTGKPLIPTLEQYKKLADGMGMTVQHLFELLDDDAPVDLSSSVPDDEARLVSAYRLASDEIKGAALSMLEDSAAKNRKTPASSAG